MHHWPGTPEDLPPSRCSRYLLPYAFGGLMLLAAATICFPADTAPAEVLATPCTPYLLLGQLPASASAPAPRVSEAPSRAGETPTTGPTTQPVVKKPNRRVVRWLSAMWLGVLLLLILVFSSIALIVFSRRYRSWLLRDRRVPTPSEDLWVRQKLPPEVQKELENRDPEEPPEEDQGRGPTDN